jgi:hypothetical protein
MSGCVEKKIKSVSNPTVTELKQYLQMRGVTVNGYLKPNLIDIAQAVEKMMLPIDLSPPQSFPSFLTINKAKLRYHKTY